jgi:hypothetical protein
MTALLLGLLVAGCESSSDGSFVATPGESGNNNASTGSVTFNFVQAQSQITVPVGTTDLRFEFFTDLGGTGSLVLREDRAYAGSITIDGVPTTARSVVVTAYDSDGFPVSEFVANVTPVADGNVVVSAASGTSSPVTLTGITSSPLSLSLGLDGVVALQISATFSNGDSVPLGTDVLAEVQFTSSDTTVATVSAEGVVSAALNGEALITAVFRGQTVAVPVTVSNGSVIPPLATDLAVDPTAVSLPTGTVSQRLTLTATFEGGVQREVTINQGVVFTSSNPGITVNSDQQIVIGNNVAAGAATVTATYLGQTAQVQVTVIDATLQSIAVSPSSVSLPFGGFEQSLAVTGQFSNGSSVQLDPSNLAFSDDSALFTVDANGDILTANSGTPGSGTIFISTVAPLPSFSLEVDVTVGAVFIASLQTNPGSPVTLTPGGFIEFQVIATLSSGGTINVTDFAALVTTLNDTDGSAVLNGNRVVAVNATNPDPTVTFSLPGAGSGGDDVSTVVTITINEVVLTSAQYLFAGNPVSANEDTLNLPRGYVGIFEVVGTFSNGTVRNLTSDEYEIVEAPGGNDPSQAVEVFDSSYTLPAVRPDYTDGGSDDLVVDPRTAVVLDAVNNRSTFSTFVVSNTFRGVAADWRRGEFGDAGYLELDSIPNSPNSGNVGNKDFFDINIDNSLEGTPGAFTRRVSVTVTDPDGFQSLSTGSGVFPNYPRDPNIPTGIAREFEIRVNFNPRTIGDNGVSIADPGTRPPSTLPQNGFKLAEANLIFESDQPGFNPDLLVHRPTALGFVSLVANNPVAIGAIDIYVQPLGGLNGRTQLDPTTPPPDDRVLAQDQFGPSFPVTFNLSPQPSVITQVIRTFTRVDNNGTGFDIVNPTLLTLDPIGPLTLQVGEGQLFRTLIQYGAGNQAVDRSLDYRPYIATGEGTAVVGAGDLDSGRLTVSAVAANLAATVRVLDITESNVAPRGTSFTDSRGVTGAPSTQVNINTVPIP